jgi:hypothetical protein
MKPPKKRHIEPRARRVIRGGEKSGGEGRGVEGNSRTASDLRGPFRGSERRRAYFTEAGGVLRHAAVTSACNR